MIGHVVSCNVNSYLYWIIVNRNTNACFHWNKGYEKKRNKQTFISGNQSINKFKQILLVGVSQSINQLIRLLVIIIPFRQCSFSFQFVVHFFFYQIKIIMPILCVVLSYKMYVNIKVIMEAYFHLSETGIRIK